MSTGQLLLSSSQWPNNHSFTKNFLCLSIFEVLPSFPPKIFNSTPQLHILGSTHSSIFLIQQQFSILTCGTPVFPTFNNSLVGYRFNPHDHRNVLFFFSLQLPMTRRLNCPPDKSTVQDVFTWNSFTTGATRHKHTMMEKGTGQDGENVSAWFLILFQFLESCQ
jgi:hypothetical protein